MRANGTLIERNSFDRGSLSRLDMRVQRQFKLGNKAAIDGIVEVFNLFNHANYASFTTNEMPLPVGSTATSCTSHSMSFVRQFHSFFARSSL